MTSRKRAAHKRNRPKRRTGKGGGSLPNRSQSHGESEISSGDLKQARRAHMLRSASARRTDESMKAPLAGSLDAWLANPNRLDLPGVDYPGKALYEALEKTTKKKVPGNPFQNSESAKDTIQPIIEEYRKKLGIESDVKVSAVNRGHPARVIQQLDGGSPVVRFNYQHFQDLYGLIDEKTFKTYVEYAVSHEVAHIQQREQLGWTEYRASSKRDHNGFELDADIRACHAMGTTPETIVGMIDGAEKKLLAMSNSPVKELEEKPSLPTEAKEDQRDHEQRQQVDVTEQPSLIELRNLHSEVIPEKPRTLPGSGKQPEEHWLPPQLEEELIKEWNRSETEKTGVALVKYFTPDGSASWYLSEYYPEDDVFYGYCDMGTGFPELGYVSRKELRDNVGKMGLPIERDYYFTPEPLNKLQGKKEQPQMPPGYESIKEKKSRENKDAKKVVSESLYDELEKRKFWAYSGEDGDLYRKQGLGGWRVQVYWGSDLAIQHKITDELGTRWVTVADFDKVEEKDRSLVMDYVDEWMRNPSVLEDRPLNETVTLDDLKQPQTSHRHEPKKSAIERSHQGSQVPLIRPKGTKERPEYYGKVMPYTLIHNLDTVEQITVKDGSMHVRGMGPSHIAMIDLEIPNRLGVPDGEYSGEALNWGDNNKSLYQTPDRVEWRPMQDGGEIQFTKGDKTIRLALKKGFNDTELPEPRIRFNAKSDIDLKQLQSLINESTAAHIEIQAYPAEDGRNKLRAWWNEERAGGAVDPVSHEVILNEDLGELEKESQTTYDKEYLKTLLDNLTRSGLTTGEIQFSTDMPLQLETEGPEAVTRFWLAPCIDVGGGGDRYHPEDPRTILVKGPRDKQEWRNMATPYSVFSYIAAGGDVDVHVKGNHAILRAMDSDHIGMIEVETGNQLDIPDGEYGGSLGGVSGNIGTYRYPEKILWDPELNQLIIDKKGNQAVVDMEAGIEYAQLPQIKEGDTKGDLNLSRLSKALNNAWKHQKNEYNPSISFKQQDNEITLEHADSEGNLRTETISLEHAQGTQLASTSYNPEKLRNFLKIIETLDPEHVAIKQNEGQVLTLEAVKNDTVIRYHLAPMIGA